ncbi:MAG: TIR domain-containing protein [Solobacterium sp.]|nr:TIR domain-containing protein [Solobacterium sp.]
MGRKYNAFISYRHNERDTLVASELQTQLERFHIPKAIAEQTGIRKIDRIFRDQNELELTSDLAKDIDEALADSDFLIVVLSEAYNQSKWCLHEIEQFRKTHDADRILAVISQGEPPGIFPDSLMRTQADGTVSEPLACDYRIDLQKAKRIELPRLVSAMLGCEYDDLVLRNETYRRNRILAVSGGFAVLAAAAIAWLLYSNAEISRNYREAQIHESKRIASEALEDLEGGLRLKAISESLSALPSETERPVTSEALYTLSRASLAYQLPYHTVETGQIDLTADIRRICGSEEEHLLFVIDEADAVHAYDTSTLSLLGSWETSGTKEGWKPVVSGRNLVYWTEDGVTAVSAEGNPVWTQFMRYSVYGTVALSNDKTKIAAADVTAVELINAEDGSPLASLVLPEEETYYVQDLCWADDDRSIAMVLRSSKQEGYRLGMFDTEHGTYTFLSDIPSPDDVFILEDGSVVIASCDTLDRTFERNGDIYLYSNEMLVSCYSTDGLRWEATVPFTAEHAAEDIIHSLVYSDHEDLIITASDTVSVLDSRDGSLIQKRQIGSPVLHAFDLINNSLFLITADGRFGTVWLEDTDAMLERLFPDHLSQAEVFHGSNAVINEYAILHDGNVSWFSSAFDNDLRIMNGTGFFDPGDEGVLGDGTAAVRVMNDLYLYDTVNGVETASLHCEEDELLYLLRNDAVCDHLGLLRTRLDDGSILLEIRSMKDLSLVKTIPLKLRDSNASAGIYAQIDQIFDTMQYSRKNMMAVRQYSSSASPFAVRNNQFCYFDGTDTGLNFHSISLADGSESEVPLDLAEYGTAVFSSTGNDVLSFVLNDTGTAGLFAIQSKNTGTTVPALFNTSDGSLHILEDTVLSRLCFAQDDKASISAVCGTDGIALYDASFRKTAVIPYPGSTCLAMYLDDSTLYALFSDGVLRSYDRSGTLINELILSFTDTDEFFLDYFRLERHGDTLAVFEGEQLEFVDLSKTDTRPAAVVPEHVLSWSADRDEILVYTYNGKADSSRFYAGILPHYTPEQLIEKGTSELDHR